MHRIDIIPPDPDTLAIEEAKRLFEVELARTNSLPDRLICECNPSDSWVTLAFEEARKRGTYTGEAAERLVQNVKDIADPDKD